MLQRTNETLEKPGGVRDSVLSGHKACIECVALTPNGKRAISGSPDKTIKVWDLESGTCTRNLTGHKKTIFCVALTPNGKRAISGSGDKTLKVWDLESGTCNATLKGHKDTVTCVALTRDGRRAISGSRDKTLRLWDLEAGTLIYTLQGHDERITSVALTPNGKRAISGSADKTLKMWDLEAHTCTATLPGHESVVSCVALSKHGKHAISGSRDKTLKVWDLEAGTCTATLMGHEQEVTSVAVTPDGRRAISGCSGDKTLKVWDLEVGTCTATLAGQSKTSVSCVALTPDGKRAISGNGSEDKTLKVWDLEASTCTATLLGHKQKVTCVALTEDGMQAISGSEDRALKVWDLEAGTSKRTLTGHAANVTTVALTPDGQRAISGSEDKTLKVWDLGSASDPVTLTGHKEAVSCVALTPNGKRAISGSQDHTLKLWDLESGSDLITLQGHDKGITTVALTHNGKRAISGSADHTLKVWDLESARDPVTLHGHKDYVECVALTPDGRHAISGSRDETLKVWDLEAGTCTATLTGHVRTVSTVALTPDGKRAISGSWDKTLKVWELEVGTCTATLQGHEALVSCVALTPDGRCAISGSFGNAKVWHLEAGTCTAALPGHKERITSVALIEDGKRAISSSRDDPIQVREPEVVRFCSTDDASMPNPKLGQDSEGSEDATATLTARNPNHRFRIGDAFELQLAVQLGPKTLAATLVTLPAAGDSIQGTVEPKADSSVVFYIPVPGRLEAVQARVVPLPGSEPEVELSCVFKLSDRDLGGASGSVYRLRWVSWLSDLPRGRVDVPHGLPSLESGRLNSGLGSHRLGPFLSYMHHLAGAGNVRRQELHRQHGTQGFLATVQKWPVQRAALRIYDFLGRTPLEVLLSEEAPRPEDLSDMLEAYLHDAEESVGCGDLSALACNLECLVRCLPRIKELNMAADLVWKALDLYACTRTAASDVGISAAQHLAPVGGGFWRPKRCTFTARDVPVPSQEKRESERFHLLRCSVPSLFDSVPSGVFSKLLPASAEVQQEVSQVKTVAPLLPFVPWETILEQMPKRFFAMPLARAAVEHRRPTAILAVAFAVHLLITVLFCVLLTWRPGEQARLVLVSVLAATDVLLVLEEALQMVDSFNAAAATKPWAKRVWSAAASYLGSFYNVIDLALCLSPPVLLLVLLLAGPDSPGYLMVLALGALSCFLKYLNFMRAVPYFAPIVAMMERIIDRTRPDMALLLVLTAGFGAANHTLLHASRYYELHFWQMLLRHLLRYTLGDAGIFEYQSQSEIVEGVLEVDDGVYLDASHVLDNPLLFAMFIIVNIGYAYLTVVIFFNLLIARMASIYEEVEERQLSSLTYSCANIFEEYHRKWEAAKRLVGFHQSQATSPGTPGAVFLFRWHPVTNAPWEPSTRAAPESGTRPIFKTFHMVEDLEDGVKAQGDQLQEVRHQLLEVKQLMQAKQQKGDLVQPPLTAAGTAPRSDVGRQLAELKELMEEVKQRKGDDGPQEPIAVDVAPQSDVWPELTALTLGQEKQEERHSKQGKQLAELRQEQAEQGRQLADLGLQLTDIKEQQAKILLHLSELMKRQ